MGFIIPANAVTHFHLREGDRVADFGAGSGHFSLAMARAVGSAGRIYAIEIQRDLAKRIADEARARRITNVEVMWGDLEAGIRLPDSSVDVAVLANTLFQIKNKEHALAEIQRILDSRGRLYIIDWTDSWGGAGPHPESIVKEKDAQALAESIGFVYERSFPAGDHHYGIGLRKK